jgi:hypothetical protein
MIIHSFWKSALLLAALAFFATCCGDMPEAEPEGSDADSDGDTDSDSDSDYDSDIDTGTECECTSVAENYCDGDTVMECLDGCHFTPYECTADDCGSYGCEDGECWFECGCGEDTPKCYGDTDEYCADALTLMECVIFGDGCSNYYQEVSCYDPVACPSGSGCAGEGVSAACWCDESDGGVDDAGVDGGK